MKISASVYSDENNTLVETIKGLNDFQVDVLHVDCRDNLEIFNDIATIRAHSNLPIDLHIITDEPQKYFDGLVEYQPEYVTFQFETLKNKTLTIPNEYKGKRGIGIVTDTDIDIFEDYKNEFDFILMMATTPGYSGGSFDKSNFQKIRSFRRNFPSTKIHVDGGVNDEVSFILRNMGVYLSVSGSFIFKQDSIGSALLKLKLFEVDSHFQVKDFMITTENSPVVKMEELNLYNLLNEMNEGNLGMAVVTSNGGTLEGIIGNGDLRKGLMNNIENLNDIDLKELINPNPIVINEDASVHEMLKFIKNQSRPILYLPVINNNKQFVGTVSFQNLIKGEL